MKKISKILIIPVFCFTFWVQAESASDNYTVFEVKSDSIKVTVEQKENKSFANIKGTTNTPENKTNWSKIKDLFM